MATGRLEVGARWAAVMVPAAEPRPPEEEMGRAEEPLLVATTRARPLTQVTPPTPAVIPTRECLRAPTIVVTPDPTLAFGVIGFVPTATPLVATRFLNIRNGAPRPQPPDVTMNLHLGAPAFSATALSGAIGELCVGQFNTSTQTCDGTLPANYDSTLGLVGGSSGIDLPVHIIPQTAGLKHFEVIIYSNDPETPEKHITITATAVAAQPCDYSVTPAVLDFGIVASATVISRSFTLHNNGTQPNDVCYFSGIAVAPESDPSFALDTSQTDLQLQPGASASLTVQLTQATAPGMQGTISGAVLFSVPTATSNSGQVSVQATLSTSCLVISPGTVDFGDVPTGCSSGTLAVTINNACQTPVTYSGAVLSDAAGVPNGTGDCADAAGCPQFSLVSVPAAATIPAGGQRTITVRFRPYTQGPHDGQLDITLQTTSTPFVTSVALTGAGAEPPANGQCVTATCPGPMTVGAATVVTLPVSVMSQGSDTCAWSVVSRPSSSSGTFSAPSSCSSTTYGADTIGTHELQFTVTSGGETATCTTPITVVPNGDLWVELSWNTSADMDLYLTHPHGSVTTPIDQATFEDDTWANNWNHNSYAHTQSWGPSGTPDDPFLTGDDIGGVGPENQRIQSPEVNVTYGIGVHAYSGSNVTSTVKVYCGGSLVATQVFVIPYDALWVVGTLQFQNLTTCTYTSMGTGTVYTNFTP